MWKAGRCELDDLFRSRSLRFLGSRTQRVQWDRLRARYRQLSTYDKEAVRKLKRSDLIEMIRRGRPEIEAMGDADPVFFLTLVQELRSASWRTRMQDSSDGVGLLFQ